MKKLKEYKKRLENGVSYGGRDYLWSNERSELRQEVKNKGKVLSGSNYRACEIKTENGYILQSYYTEVAFIDFDGNFKKLWDGFSVTTLKHVNIFRELHNLKSLSKYEWVMLDCEGLSICI